MRGVQGIGGHAKPNCGASQVWLTPPEIVSSLGSFDLDPCAAPAPRPWATARRHIEPPADGLVFPWTGRVWLNPPYDEQLEAWMAKMARHGIGIALTFARTETAIWHSWIWPYAESILFVAGRLHFWFPDGTRAEGNAGGPSALIAYSRNDSNHLWLSGIAGAHVEIVRPRVGVGGPPCATTA